MADMIDKPATAKSPEEEVDIHVMPDEFRGVMPISSSRQKEKDAGVQPPPVPPQPPKPVMPPPVSVVSPPIKPVAKIAKKKNKLLIPGLIGAGVVVIGSAVGLFLWLRGREPALPAVVCGNTICEVGETSASCPLDCAPQLICGDLSCDTGETAESCFEDCGAQACGDAVCQSFESFVSCPSDCVPSAPQPGIDSDNDGLTDLEETSIYGSSPFDQDTDLDTFVDLNEVLNLFDPSVPAPAELSNNFGITVYNNLDYNFSVLVPRVWSVIVDAENQSVSFSPREGERVVVTRIEKLEGEVFNSTFTTKSGLPASSTNRMLNRVDAGEAIFEVRYENFGALTVEYNVTYDMILASLKLLD